jgi:predicted  nucleic acid-binding Zn-ribbon protein
VAQLRQGTLRTGADVVMAAKPFKGICAWCNRTFREGKEPAKHGICAECERKLFEEIEQNDTDEKRKAIAERERIRAMYGRQTTTSSTGRIA